MEVTCFCNAWNRWSSGFAEPARPAMGLRGATVGRMGGPVERGGALVAR